MTVDESLVALSPVQNYVHDGDAGKKTFIVKLNLSSSDPTYDTSVQQCIYIMKNMVSSVYSNVEQSSLWTDGLLLQHSDNCTQFKMCVWIVSPSEMIAKKAQQLESQEGKSFRCYWNPSVV